MTRHASQAPPACTPRPPAPRAPYTQARRHLPPACATAGYGGGQQSGRPWDRTTATRLPSSVGTRTRADRGPGRPAQALTQTKPNPLAQPPARPPAHPAPLYCLTPVQPFHPLCHPSKRHAQPLCCVPSPPVRGQRPMRCWFIPFGTVGYGGAMFWWSVKIKCSLCLGAGDGISGTPMTVPPLFAPPPPPSVHDFDAPPQTWLSGPRCCSASLPLAPHVNNAFGRTTGALSVIFSAVTLFSQDQFLVCHPLGLPNPGERLGFNLVHKKCSPQIYKRGGWVCVGQKSGGWVQSWVGGL